ncbi:unnamed protein product, partial [marine sediment metagenome]
NIMNKKRDDEIYCPECSKIIKRKAVFCPDCGVQLKELEAITKTPATEVEPEIIAKKKWVAIVLAVFFNFWAWLYTYKKSYKKFWIVFSITLGVPVITFIILFSLPQEIGANIFTALVFFSGFYFLGTEIWVLIDYAKKPKSFYEIYP